MLHSHCVEKDSYTSVLQARALDKKANKPERMKVQKDGSVMWTEIEELAALIRSGKVHSCFLLTLVHSAASLYRNADTSMDPVKAHSYAVQQFSNRRWWTLQASDPLAYVPFAG